MTEHPGLRVTRTSEEILTVTLANPDKRNPQTPTMWAALEQIARTLPPQVRVVILNADGPDFSAGLDRLMLSPDGISGEPKVLSLAANRGVGETADTIAHFQRGFTAWGECDAIVIAAVQGNAIGAGFQLALAADLRIVAEDVKFAMREPSLGLVPDLGGTLPLVRTVGYSRALEILVTSRFVGGPEAVGAGLATLVVPNEKLQEVTLEVAEAIMAEVTDAALRATKKLLRAAVDNSPAQQLELERLTQAQLLVDVVGKGLEQRPHDHHDDHDHDHDH